MADVKLDEIDGTYLLLEGRVIKAISSDFMLDVPARRTSPTPNFRRALVHDQGDGLTVNYAGDYPGGLRLVGVTEIVPKASGAFASIVVRGGISYEVQSVSLAGGTKTVTVHLSDELAHLKARVAALEAKVK